MEGMRRKKALSTYATNEEGGSDDKEDDDAEYYRSEVGQEPEKGFISLSYFEKLSSLIEHMFHDCRPLHDSR